VIATPGRLLDHMNSTKSFNMNQLRWLVLDEADRLLDMGFEKDISAILSSVKERTGQSKHQIVLTSATLHDRVLYGMCIFKLCFVLMIVSITNEYEQTYVCWFRQGHDQSI